MEPTRNGLPELSAELAGDLGQCERFVICHGLVSPWAGIEALRLMSPTLWWSSH